MTKYQKYIAGGILAAGIFVAVLASRLNDKHSRLFDYYDSLDESGKRQFKHTANSILNKIIGDE